MNAAFYEGGFLLLLWAKKSPQIDDLHDDSL